MCDRRTGVIWSLLSAILWSTTYIAARYLLADGKVDPVTLSLLRFLVGGLVLFAIGVIRYRRAFFALTAGDVGRLALLGLLGVAGMSVLLFVGQQTTLASHSVIIMQLTPVMIALLGLLIGERLSSRKVTGMGLALAGSLLVVGLLGAPSLSLHAGYATGNLLVLLAALCWALYTVLGKSTVARLGGFRTSTWAMLFGTAELVLLRALLPTPIVWPQGNATWLIVLYLALFPTALAFVAWYEALRRLPLALLNVMQYITPPCTLLLAWGLLGETLAGEAWLGVVLILTGVLLVSAAERRPAILPVPLPAPANH